MPPLIWLRNGSITRSGIAPSASPIEVACCPRRGPFATAKSAPLPPFRRVFPTAELFWRDPDEKTDRRQTARKKTNRQAIQARNSGFRHRGRGSAVVVPQSRCAREPASGGREERRGSGSDESEIETPDRSV